MTGNKTRSAVSYRMDYPIEDNRVDNDRGFSRKSLVHNALYNAMEGIVSRESAESFLDKIEIRGSFNKFGYTGYDYQYQVWVEFKKC